MISQEIAVKAALLYGRAKWGKIRLLDPIPLLHVSDDSIAAYLFPVCLGNSDPDDLFKFGPELAAMIDGYKSMKASQGKAGTEHPQLSPKDFLSRRKAVLRPKEFGTILINADDTQHPLMMACAGKPFTVVSGEIARNIHDNIPGKSSVVFRLDRESGHIWGEFGAAGTKNNAVYSMFDPLISPSNQVALLQKRKERFAEINKKILSDLSKEALAAREKYSIEKQARLKKKWEFIKQLSHDYLNKISPEYIVPKHRTAYALKSINSHYIPDVPDLYWTRGCYPTAAANILTYWDKRGYGKLVDDPGKDEYDLINELADAMGTDSEGDTWDHNVDDGIGEVVNDTNGYDFEIDGPDSSSVWGKIKTAIDAGRPCHLILHWHDTYGNHGVTVVGYREVTKDCAADDHFVTIHDTWGNGDVEIPYEGSVATVDPTWQVTRLTPGGGLSSGSRSGWGWWDLGRPPIGGGQFVGSLSAVTRHQGPWVLDIFGIGQDNHVLQYALSSAGWQWVDLGAVPQDVSGGGLTSSLTAVSRREGPWVIDIFAVGRNGHVIQYALDSTGWKWLDLGAVPSNVGGGGLTGPLTAVSRREGPWVIDIFAVGRNGHVIQYALDSTGWKWLDLGAVPSNVGGGGLTSPLTAVSRREGPWVIDIFAVGRNGHVIQYALDSTGWKWLDLGAVPSNVGGGGLAGPLGAVSRRHGQWVLDVFGLGLNGHVLQYALDSTGWKWFDLGTVPSSIGGGGLAGPLTAVSRREGPWIIDLLGVGSSHDVVQFALSEVPVAIP